MHHAKATILQGFPKEYFPIRKLIRYSQLPYRVNGAKNWVTVYSVKCTLVQWSVHPYCWSVHSYSEFRTRTVKIRSYNEDYTRTVKCTKYPLNVQILCGKLYSKNFYNLCNFEIVEKFSEHPVSSYREIDIHNLLFLIK